jgi:peptidoglycan/xylan/chitin deacetylase (PgdA/CDA1 family)
MSMSRDGSPNAKAVHGGNSVVHFATNDTTNIVPIVRSNSLSSAGTMETSTFVDAFCNLEEIEVAFEHNPLDRHTSELFLTSEKHTNDLNDGEPSLIWTQTESDWQDLQSKLFYEQMEREELEKLYSQSCEEVRSLQQQCVTVLGLDSSLKKAIAEIDRLRKVPGAEYTDRDKELEDAKLQLEAWKIEVMQLRCDMSDKQDEHNQIRVQFELELDQRMEQFQKETVSKWEQALLQANDEIDQLKSCIKEATQEQQEESPLNFQREFLQLQFEYMQVQERLDATRAENLQICKEANETVEKLQLELQRLSEERHQLVLDLESSIEEQNRLRFSIKEDGKVPREELSKAVRQAVESRDRSIVDLRRKLSEMEEASKQSTEDHNWLTARLHVAQEEITLLQRKIVEQQQFQEKDLLSTQSQRNHAQAECKRLKTKLDAVHAEYQTAKIELESIRSQLTNLSDLTEQRIAMTSDLEKRILETESRLFHVENENSTLRQHLKDANRVIEMHRDENSRVNLAKVMGIGSTVDSTGSRDIVDEVPLEFMQIDDLEPREENDRNHRIDESEMQSNEILELSDKKKHQKPESLSKNLKADSIQMGSIMNHSEASHIDPTVQGGSSRHKVSSTPVESCEVKVVESDVPFSNLNNHPASDDLSPKLPNILQQDQKSAFGSKELESFERHIHSWPISWHDNDGRSKYGERDIIGYGSSPPKPMWPEMAKVALNFVIHFDDGADVPHPPSNQASTGLDNQHNLNLESWHDYGARAGFWRLHRLFTNKAIPCTVFAVGQALERNLPACRIMKDANWEVASQGYVLTDYRNLDADTLREHLRRTISIHQKLIGTSPSGVYLGNLTPESRSIVSRYFYYDSDSYSDDIPYWTMEDGKPHLVIPYSLSLNDKRFDWNNGYDDGVNFWEELVETLK